MITVDEQHVHQAIGGFGSFIQGGLGLRLISQVAELERSMLSLFPNDPGTFSKFVTAAALYSPGSRTPYYGPEDLIPFCVEAKAELESIITNQHHLYKIERSANDRG